MTLPAASEPGSTAMPDAPALGDAASTYRATQLALGFLSADLLLGKTGRQTHCFSHTQVSPLTPPLQDFMGCGCGCGFRFSTWKETHTSQTMAEAAWLTSVMPPLMSY